MSDRIRPTAQALSMVVPLAHKLLFLVPPHRMQTHTHRRPHRYLRPTWLRRTRTAAPRCSSEPPRALAAPSPSVRPTRPTRTRNPHAGITICIIRDPLPRFALRPPSRLAAAHPVRTRPDNVTASAAAALHSPAPWSGHVPSVPPTAIIRLPPAGQLTPRAITPHTACANVSPRPRQS